MFGLLVLNRFWTVWGPSYNNNDLLKWDVFGYYTYIPATLIYDDPGIRNKAWLDTLYNKYKPSDTQYQFTKGENGKTVIRYPVGMAVQWAPFVFAGHLLAESFGYPADGLSPPYSWSVLIGGLIYAFIGLWFLRKVLLHFFSENVTMITMVLITMGTNYWAQVASDTVMPHSNLFTLTTIVLWCTIKWHESPKLKYAVGLGLSLGLATISRPTEIIWILVPLLWNVKDFQTLVFKIKLAWTHRLHFIVFSLALVSMLMLQLSYWKYTSGSWVYYSYEGYFSLSSPFFIDAFFSYKKGWLLYTPLMIFAIAGFVIIFQRRREVFYSILFFFCFNCWVIMSWECWWYAACFSNRALVEMYPAMAVSLGYMVTFLIDNRGMLLKTFSIVVLSTLLLLNLFQHWQYNHGLLDGERITKAFYWRMFLNTRITDEDKALLEPEHWLADETITDFSNLNKVLTSKVEFENQTSTHAYKFDTIAPHSGNGIQVLDSSHQFSLVYKELYENLTSKDLIRIRTKVWMRFDSSFSGKEPPMIIFDFGLEGRTRKYKQYHVDTLNKTTGQWFQFTADYIPPLHLHRDDRFATYIWNPSGVPISIDDMEIEVYEQKH